MPSTIYLDRLTSEYDELTTGIDSLLERAAAESRDLTDDENAQIEREDTRRSELQAAIATQSERLERESRVSDLRTRVRIPAPVTQQVRTGGAPPEENPDAWLLREFPTAGDYAAAFHRATFLGDREAAALIERATAHQTTTDNPGLIPRPIIAPVINRLRSMRPLIQSVGVQTATAPKFDRPKVTQNVDVDVQVNEKDLTASQKMLIGNVPVELETYAGHLNLSKQDLRWSTPSLLDLVYQSFEKVYARRTDKAACADFATAVNGTQPVDAWDAASIDEALGAAGATVETADGDMGEFNHIWMSRNVAVKLGAMRNPTTGQKLYNIPIVGGTSGDLDGIPVTIDPRFAAGTMIGGDDTLVEFWEDLEGFLSVDEPGVLGQMVGYAGYGSLAVLDTTGFVQFTIPVIP